MKILLKLFFASLLLSGCALFVDEYQKQISINDPCAIKGKVVSFNQSLEIEVYHISKNLLDYKLYCYFTWYTIENSGINGILGIVV